MPDEVLGIELVDANVGHHGDDHLLLLPPHPLPHWLTAFEQASNIPSFLPFLAINSLPFSSAWFRSLSNDLVSLHDFSLFLPFCVSYCATLSTLFLVFCQSFQCFSVFQCFNWVVSGLGCVSWLRPSGGSLHCSAAWSGQQIVRAKNSTYLNQIQQEMLCRLWKMFRKWVSWL